MAILKVFYHIWEVFIVKQSNNRWFLILSKQNDQTIFVNVVLINMCEELVLSVI